MNKIKTKGSYWDVRQLLGVNQGFKVGLENQLRLWHLLSKVAIYCLSSFEVVSSLVCHKDRLIHLDVSRSCLNQLSKDLLVEWKQALNRRCKVCHT